MGEYVRGEVGESNPLWPFVMVNSLVLATLCAAHSDGPRISIV